MWTGEIHCGPVELQRFVTVQEGGPSDCQIEKHVTIQFPEGGYQFTLAEAAAGVKLNYTITVSQELSGVIPTPQGAGNIFGPDTSGLRNFEEISGHGQSYAIRDIGYGLPPSREPITIKEGRYSYAVEWWGKNWSGPSDTAQPQGPPFPVGKYCFEVSLAGEVQTPRGERPYRIAGIAPVILSP